VRFLYEEAGHRADLPAWFVAKYAAHLPPVS
jgi:hypothetical protein